MANQTIVMGNPGRRTVDEASDMLKKMYLVERETMRTLAGYLVSASNWELKKSIPRLLWQDAQRADMLRTRVLEMRYPRRDVDQKHYAPLQSYLQTLILAANDAELVQGVFLVTKVQLVIAYEDYLKEIDDLVDAPTFAFLPRFVQEARDQINEILKIYSRLEHFDRPEVTTWGQALTACLSEMGGLLGEKTGSAIPTSLPQRPVYTLPIEPVRDPRFLPAKYHMPPREPRNFIERQVWQGINHVNEIWAAEVPATVLWKWNDMPWEFYLDCSRWAYDECRHALMGERRLKAWGFEIGVDVPVYGDHYASQAAHGELNLLALLHTLETSGPAWKSGLKKDFEEEGDTASSQDFDYDWADESIHLAYGYKWTLHRLGGDMELLEAKKEETLNRWRAWWQERQEQWDYEPFMSRIQQKIAEIEARHHG
ncbi:toxic anion resistance protein [Paenibacillus sp. N1-5-1-14]|uniref:toxic anion resistance protein n=1 Tax=Paenibacillus radicibacter TaxID=2972488 RepID=UPI0021590406|nr:toxic anion resistance protein [Paenibacillus radicibacter]MCR8643068.1 toxic anion resistance protein [Paenibacillus radicibacter]